jgi:hypothetical protein
MVTFQWIEKQISFLTTGIEIYKLSARNDFFFDPSPGFYGFIAQGKTDALNQAMRMLANHLESRSAPMIEEWKDLMDPLVTGDYDWSSNKEPAGFIRYRGPQHSRIEINVTNKHSHFVLGAVLAHELTHHFLAVKGINLPDELENEKLTDLATVYLGLGKLTLNGYYPLTWTVEREKKQITYTYRIGYLSCKDIARVFHRVCAFRYIPLEITKPNLSEDALDLLSEVHEQACTFEQQKHLVGERQCLHCGKFVFFGFHKDDDQIYCPECGWEWVAIIKHANKMQSKRFSFRKVMRFIARW